MRKARMLLKAMIGLAIVIDLGGSPAHAMPVAMIAEGEIIDVRGNVTSQFSVGDLDDIVWFQKLGNKTSCLKGLRGVS